MDRSNWPQLGDRVKEIVSGFEGVVTGFCEYLWGCEQVLVSKASADPAKDGAPKAEWFDVGRVEILERGALKAVTTTASGADVPAPIR